MNKFMKFSSLVIILCFLLGACTAPSTTNNIAGAGSSSTEIPKPDTAQAGDDILYLNLTWHQHQPLITKMKTVFIRDPG